MNYLALDYGLKHVGVAFSGGFLAEPLTQLTNNDQDILMKEIAKICIEHDIDKLVMGISEGEMADITRKFSKKLQTVLQIPIVFCDESLSSKIATKKMIESGAKRKKRQNKQHQVAAAVILQDYLDNNIESSV